MEGRDGEETAGERSRIARAGGGASMGGTGDALTTTFLAETENEKHEIKRDNEYF